MHSRTCRLRIEAGLRADNPETPALVRRDERHIKWAEADAQMVEPNADDAGPRRGGRDTDNEAEVEFDEDQASEFATPVLDDSDEDMSTGEQLPAPAERRSTVRQREPAVDEDDLPLDDVEDSALKRRRLGQLCNRSLLTEITEIFDKQSVNKLEHNLRRTQRRNFGNSRTDVAEIYSPPRMAAMAQRLRYTPGFSWT